MNVKLTQLKISKGLHLTQTTNYSLLSNRSTSVHNHGISVSHSSGSQERKKKQLLS